MESVKESRKTSPVVTQILKPRKERDSKTGNPRSLETSAMSSTARTNKEIRNSRAVIEYPAAGYDELTILLRHDLSSTALGDVLTWAVKCVEAEEIVRLEGWLIKFKDYERVLSTREVCRSLELVKMRVVCEELLGRLRADIGIVGGITRET